nr:hypothetical protein CFP56_50948 [Quercus suber]
MVHQISSSTSRSRLVGSSAEVLGSQPSSLLYVHPEQTEQYTSSLMPVDYNLGTRMAIVAKIELKASLASVWCLILYLELEKANFRRRGLRESHLVKIHTIESPVGEIRGRQ